MHKKYLNIILLFNIVLLLTYLFFVPSWWKTASIGELNHSYPHFYIPIFIYSKYGLYIHILGFLPAYRKYPQAIISKIVKHHVYLLILPFLTFINIRFYPNLNFPNLDFLLHIEGNKDQEIITHKNIKELMKPLEVHQSVYLIHYLHDAQFTPAATAYIEEKTEKSK